MRRHLRVARCIATDRRVPRWLRGLLIFGILPIPGPVDNVALIVGLLVLAVWHRPLIAEHYRTDGLAALVPLDTWGAWG